MWSLSSCGRGILRCVQILVTPQPRDVPGREPGIANPSRRSVDSIAASGSGMREGTTGNGEGLGTGRLRASHNESSRELSN